MNPQVIGWFIRNDWNKNSIELTNMHEIEKDMSHNALRKELLAGFFESKRLKGIVLGIDHCITGAVARSMFWGI